MPGAEDGVEVEEGVVERKEEALRLPVPARGFRQSCHLHRHIKSAPEPTPLSHAARVCARRRRRRRQRRRRARRGHREVAQN